MDNRHNKPEAKSAIELAILNGIEAYNREQEKRKAKSAEKGSAERAASGAEGAQSKNAERPAADAKRAQKRAKSGAKNAETKREGSERKDEKKPDGGEKRASAGESRSRAAMEEAGYKPRRPSRAKGKGTKVLLASEPAPRSAADQKKAMTPAAEQKKGKAPAAEPSSVPVPPPSAETKGKRGRKKQPVKILFFGGVGEIGKNMTAIEYGNDIIVIDAGIIFPTEEMPGIDLVFPDITYLVNNRQKIRGVFLTHGHEDHIGGVPYLMKEIDQKTPVYGTKLTLALTDNKLREHKLNNLRLITVAPKDKVKAGAFTVNFINVNHSIAGALALAVETPYGVIFHSGDFKIDLTPVAGKPIDLAEIAEYGRKGVLLYLGESTNVERPGYTMSETVVGTTLEHLFAENVDRRLIVATFASNVHRLQQIIDIAVKYRRKVALSGRSMFNVVEAALKIGELIIPEGVLVDVEKTKNFFDREIVIVSTGSQGEPMSALTRMASGDFNKITVGKNDTIIISASPIPGNERMIYRVINNLFKLGANVVYESLEKIHVSGHACQEEHKIMHTLLKPKFFIPVHGEYRHLKRHALLAEETGMRPECIFIPDVGSCAEVTDESLRQGESFPAGARLIDGEGFEDYGTSEALKDRLHMSEEGVFIVDLTLSHGVVAGDPVIESRGFVYSDERGYRRELMQVVEKAVEGGARLSTGELSANIKRAMKNYIFKKTKQSPMIIAIVREI